jgi:phage terminase small subunit
MKRKTKPQKPTPEQIATFSLYRCKKAMTPKQIRFSHEYIRDWNGTRAAKAAGYKKKTASLIASENIRKPYVKRYIELIQKDIAEEVGISKIQLLEKLKKIALAELPDMYEDWVTRKDLSEIRKNDPYLSAALGEVSTKTVQKTNAYKEPYEEECVKVKLHDPQRAIDLIFKAMSWYEPDKLNVTIEQPLFPDVGA